MKNAREIVEHVATPQGGLSPGDPRGPAAAPTRAAGVHPLAWVLLAGLLVRFTLWLYFADMPIRIDDARDYDQLAARFAETGRYMDEFGERTSLRPPLFPLLLAAIYFCFGLENHVAARAVNALISLLTVVVVFRLGREAYGDREGLWAAIGVCFYPTLLAFNNLLLSEVLFTLFFALVAWLGIRLIKRPSSIDACALGICLGLGAMTRSILWLLAPVMACYLACVLRSSGARRLATTGLMLSTFVLVIAPWSWRNTRLQGTFTLIDVMGGRNVMMGNYEFTPLERSWATVEVPEHLAWHRVLAKETPGYAHLTQGQIDKLAMKRGIRFFLEHPALSLRRTLVKFFNFWQLERTVVAGVYRGYFTDISAATIVPLAVLICGSYASLMVLSIFGATLRPPDSWRVHGLLLCLIAVPCAVHSVAFAHSRYHLPLVPILLVYSAAAALGRETILRRRRTWTTGLACAIVLLLLAGWTREIVFVDMSLLGH